MTEKKITGVDDLEVGKYYRQGKEMYFRFVGKDQFGDVVAAWACICKNSVMIEYNQSIPWLFDVNQDVEEVSDEKFFEAWGKAMKRVAKISKKVTNDITSDILNEKVKSCS